MVIGLVGISGVGKSYLRQKAISEMDGLVYLFAATTRQKLVNETDGVDKYFLSDEEFLSRELNNEMFLVQDIYGFKYGFMKSDLKPNTCYITEMLHTDIIEMRRYSEVVSIYVFSNDAGRLYTNLKARYEDWNILQRRIAKDIARKKELETQLKEGFFDFAFENRFDEESSARFLELIKDIRGTK